MLQAPNLSTVARTLGDWHPALSTSQTVVATRASTDQRTTGVHSVGRDLCFDTASVNLRNLRLFQNVWCSRLKRTSKLLPGSAIMYGPAVRRKMMLAD